MEKRRVFAGDRLGEGTFPWPASAGCRESAIIIGSGS